MASFYSPAKRDATYWTAVVFSFLVSLSCFKRDVFLISQIYSSMFFATLTSSSCAAHSLVTPPLFCRCVCALADYLRNWKSNYLKPPQAKQNVNVSLTAPITRQNSISLRYLLVGQIIRGDLGAGKLSAAVFGHVLWRQTRNVIVDSLKFCEKLAKREIPTVRWATQPVAEARFFICQSLFRRLSL